MCTCICVCVYTTCMQVLTRTKDAIRFPGSGITAVVSRPRWVLVTKLDSSERAAKALKH